MSYEHLFKHTGFKNEECNSFFYCPECLLYWKNDSEGLEYRLFIFIPMTLKGCPVCTGVIEGNEHYFDAVKYQKKQISHDDYFEKWGEFIDT